MGFDKYVEPLKIYLAKYRDAVRGDKPEKGGGGAVGRPPARAAMAGEGVPRREWEEWAWAALPEWEWAVLPAAWADLRRATAWEAAAGTAEEEDIAACPVVTRHTSAKK